MKRLFFISLLVLVSNPAWANASQENGARMLVRRMAGAYARVHDYQMMVEVRSRARNGAWETKKFKYIFKKPNHIRLDFKIPYPGMIMVFPDQDGKVVVRPYRWAPAFVFRLSPDSYFLTDPSGQSIDQTDLGRLIENISRSLTTERRGPIEIETKADHLVLRVPAVNHFRKGIVTVYRFFIDKTSWLPSRVEQSGPGGVLERIIRFQDLRTNTGISEDFFLLEGKENAP